MKIQRKKVAIIGAGNVGAGVLFSLLNSQSIAELVIIDINEKKAYGEALDAFHSTALAYSPNINVHSGDYSECQDAEIIIITAGATATPDKVVDRTALTGVNLKIISDIMNNIKKYTTDAIIIMVSNPVDILTYYAQNYFDYDSDKIIGTGTLLDTARYRRILSLKCMVDAKNVHGYILGEHGKTAFATWSGTNIAGIPIDEYLEEPINHEDVIEEVVLSGYDVLKNKGYTNFGIAKSVDRLVRALLANELSILPISTTLKGEYGINDVALSLPCVISNTGVKRILEIPLTEDEKSKLHASANYLKAIIAEFINI